MANKTVRHLRKDRPLNRDTLTTTRVVAGSLAATVLAGMIFLIWPSLDLHVASVFALGGDKFVGQTAWGNAFRRLFSWTPFVVFAGMAFAYGARRLGRSSLWAPSAAGLLFMGLSLALGPGLLVNAVLKDHSHRPRPYQVDLFGGDEAFRPFYRFDGACRRNCSFVSGETASAVWTLAPALLVPLPWRPVAVAAALAFGVAASILRMAFGGHFLSDTIFAALFTWLVILGCWRIVERFAGSLQGPTRRRNEAPPGKPSPKL